MLLSYFRKEELLSLLSDIQNKSKSYLGLIEQELALLSLLSDRARKSLQDFDLLPFGGFNKTTPRAIQSTTPSTQKMAVMAIMAVCHTFILPARGKNNTCFSSFFF